MEPRPNARFYRFPVGQISRNLNTTRQSVSRWILLEQNLKIFPVWGRYSITSQKLEFFLRRLATSGRHNSAMITIYYQMIPLQEIQFPFLPLKSIQSHSPGPYTPYKKPIPKFSATSDAGWRYGT